jgi:hypothetical protein
MQPSASYMDLSTSIQNFVERLQLNDLNFYLLYSPEVKSKQLDQDEFNEILDQATAMNPGWYEAMLNDNINIFGVSYEDVVSYFKHWRPWRISGTPMVQVRLQYH